MSYLQMEGTSDYLVALPALIATFKVAAASTVTAGQAVMFDTSHGTIKTATLAGAATFCGIVYQNGTAGDPVGVITWGYVKNVTGSGSITPGSFLTIADGDAGAFEPYTSTDPKVICGKAVTARDTNDKILAFINALG